MNLSPGWVDWLAVRRVEAIHWSAVGPGTAEDPEVMAWAAANGYVVFTHDLGFGALLASVEATGPSVLQVRTQDVMPESLGPRVLRVLEEHEASLRSGAIIVVEEARARVRILPLPRPQ